MSDALRPVAELGAWIEIPESGSLRAGGRHAPASWFRRASDEVLAGLGLLREAVVETARPAGVQVTGRGVADVNGKPTRTWATAPLTEAQVLQLRERTIAAVKAEAERRILAILPEVKQRNFLALGVEAVTLHGPDPAAWPEDLQATYADVMPKWDQIKAIRAASNAIEATIPEDAAALAAFDVAGADWPA